MSVWSVCMHGRSQREVHVRRKEEMNKNKKNKNGGGRVKVPAIDKKYYGGLK